MARFWPNLRNSKLSNALEGLAQQEFCPTFSRDTFEPEKDKAREQAMYWWWKMHGKNSASGGPREEEAQRTYELGVKPLPTDWQVAEDNDFVLNFLMHIDRLNLLASPFSCETCAGLSRQGKITTSLVKLSDSPCGLCRLLFQSLEDSDLCKEQMIIVRDGSILKINDGQPLLRLLLSPGRCIRKPASCQRVLG